MEPYSRVYQIQSLFGGRNLFQYPLAGRNSVLADAGIAETVEKAIFPYVNRLEQLNKVRAIRGTRPAK